MRVLIVDEVRSSKNLTANKIGRENEIQIVASASDIDEAREMIEKQAKDGDILVLSASLPKGGTVDLLRWMEAEHPKIKVLVTGLPESVDGIMELIEAGAEGYALRYGASTDLLNHLHALERGETVVDGEFAARLIERVAELSRLCDELDYDEDGYEQITPREREVLALLDLKYTNPDIAEALSVSTNTVKNHVHNILEKLDVDRREDAAIIFRRYQRLKDSG